MNEVYLKKLCTVHHGSTPTMRVVFAEKKQFSWYRALSGSSVKISLLTQTCFEWFVSNDIRWWCHLMIPDCTTCDTQIVRATFKRFDKSDLTQRCGYLCLLAVPPGTSMMRDIVSQRFVHRVPDVGWSSQESWLWVVITWRPGEKDMSGSNTNITSTRTCCSRDKCWI